MGLFETSQQLDTTDLEAFEVDTVMWSSSSDSSSQADGLEDRTADVEDYFRNRRNTGSANPKQMRGASAVSESDFWKCRACGWTYPDHHPTARQKLMHKKHCKGLKDDTTLLNADDAANTGVNMENQGSAGVDEQGVTHYEVDEASVVSNAETEVTAPNKSNTGNGLEQLLSESEMRGRVIDNGKGAIEELGARSRNGLHDHQIEAVHNHHDDEDERGVFSPSSSSAASILSSASPSNDAVPNFSYVEQTEFEDQDRPLNALSPQKESHSEKVPGSGGSESSLRDTDTEHAPHVASEEGLGPFSPSSASSLSSPLSLSSLSSASSSIGTKTSGVLVGETATENYDPPLDVSSSVQGDSVELVSGVNDAEPSSRQADAEIARNHIDGQGNGLNQDGGVDCGSAQAEGLSRRAAPADRASDEVKPASEVSESSSRRVSTAGEQEEVAEDSRTGSEGGILEKHSIHHPHAGNDGFREYIVESPRETAGGMEASSSKYLEAYEVERVIRTQTTHDLICPYCRHNVTDRIILRKRKRTSRVSHETWVQEYDSSSAQEVENIQPNISETVELVKDRASFWGCLSCFTIFIPKRGEAQAAQSPSDQESRSSSKCLPLSFPPFKWTAADVTVLPPARDEAGEEVIKAASEPPSDVVPADFESVEKASWLSCLPHTLTSFQVATVSYKQTEKDKPSSPETAEAPETGGSLLIVEAQTSTAEDFEEEKLTVTIKDTPPASGPPAESQEFAPADIPATSDFQELDSSTRPEKVSTSEIVEVPDEVPANTISVVSVAQEVEKTSCLSFFPATLTSFDLPRRAEPQYEYTFRQIQGEGRLKTSSDEYNQKCGASCLSCLPATFTNWDLSSTPSLEPQTDEESPSREEVQRETDEGSSVEKTSCLSCLPATFTSWEIPKPLPETSSGDSAFAEVQGTTDPLQAQEGTDVDATEDVLQGTTVLSKAEEGVHEEESTCLSWLPVTLTSWEFPQPLPPTYREEELASTVDRTDWSKAGEGIREEKTSCLSYLPVTLTSWEYPERLRGTSFDENVEASAAEEPLLSRDKETSCFSCLPLTLRSFNVAQPNLRLPEIPEPDSGTKVVHETVIQGSITNSTTVEEPEEPPKTTDRSVTYFRTSVKVADARRRFRRKSGQAASLLLKKRFKKRGGQGLAPAFSLEGQEEVEGSEWEDEVSSQHEELNDVQKLTVPNAVSVSDGSSSPIPLQLPVVPQESESQLLQPPASKSKGMLLWKTLQKRSFQNPDAAAQSSVSFWTPDAMNQLVLNWPSDWSKSSIERGPQPDWTKSSVPTVDGSLPAADVVEKIETIPQRSREIIFGPQPPTITTVSISQTYENVEAPVVDKNSEDCRCNCLPAPSWSWFTKPIDSYELDSGKLATAARPVPQVEVGSDWAELQVPLLASKPVDAEPALTTVGIRHDDLSIQVQGPDAAATLEAAVTEAEYAGILEQTGDGSEVIEILKSIVYGGLDSTLTSLAVVASAAGGEGKTITVIALGIANVLAGMLTFFLKVKSLDSETFRSTIGRNLWLNGSIAILSFIIFGMAAPITFGFTFRELDDRDYKIYATCAVAIVCVVLLGSAKAYVNKLNTWTTVWVLLATGFLSAVTGYFAGDYVTKLLKKYGFASEDSE